MGLPGIACRVAGVNHPPISVEMARGMRTPMSGGRRSVIRGHVQSDGLLPEGAPRVESARYETTGVRNTFELMVRGPRRLRSSCAPCRTMRLAYFGKHISISLARGNGERLLSAMVHCRSPRSESDYKRRCFDDQIGGSTSGSTYRSTWWASILCWRSA